MASTVGLSHPTLRGTRLRVVCLVFGVLGSADRTYGDPSIPEAARTAIFENPDFTTITLALPCEDGVAKMVAYRKRVPPPGTNIGRQMLPVASTAGGALDASTVKFLAAIGFGRIETWTWPTAYGDKWQYNFLLYSGPSPCPVIKGSVTDCQNGFTIALGERKLKELTYANQFKEARLGPVVDVVATTFTYTLDWKCSGMPPITKVFEGKGEAFLNPRDGKWYPKWQRTDRGAAEFLDAAKTMAPAEQRSASNQPASAQQAAAGGPARVRPPTGHPIIGGWRWPRDHVENRQVPVPPHELYFYDDGRVTQHAPEVAAGVADAEYIDYVLDSTRVRLLRPPGNGRFPDQCDGCPEECSGCLLDVAKEYDFTVSADELTLRWKDGKTGATETMRYTRLPATRGAAPDAVRSTPEAVVAVLFEAARTSDFSRLAELCDPKGENDGDTKRICSLGRGGAAGQSPPSPRAGAQEFVSAFKTGKVLGSARVNGPMAEVDIVFGQDGRERHETVDLILRDGTWYLSSM